MTTYNPNEAIEDQAADAVNDAISLCKAAGWSMADLEGMVAHFYECNEAAAPEPRTRE